ncbi:MAG: class I tRNA ligase family protein [Candidatus Nealsonbacteria bacterium]|nr:class I tRNA ligase family protein [Candidatus Nealsonbacteria bacterium]
MKKFYITTSIAYTNALPHIGFALESIQADVLARYNKSLNKDVFFLTGTDEHGTKIAKAAKSADKSPKEFVDEISNKFKELGKLLNLSNNDFIRTTDEKRHWPVVEKVWKKLEKNKDIYKKQYVGLYCSGCEAFLKTKDLKGGKCRIHLIKPEKISEENYFFKLTKYLDKVKKAIESDKLKIIPETRKNEILSIINQEPEDVSFSRSSKKLNWGIPVPGDDAQRIYVWADALTNYISALDYPNGKQFKKYWPADIHCIGKDRSPLLSITGNPFC